MEDIIDIIVTETTNLIEITSQPTDEIIDVNIIDNREDITLNVTPSVVEININSLTGNFGVNWGDIEGTLSNQTDLQTVLNAKADLVDGKVPSSQLPSYVDDVVEVANYASLPVTGEVGKIYITLDTNFIYRWSGSTYIEIKDSSAVWGAITGTLSSQTDLQSALDAKVPYTGATGNVNLGEYGATVGYLGFDTTPTSTPTGIGTMYWDSANRTVSLIDGDGDTTLQIGQEERVLVHNNTGSTLTDGQVVYVIGSTGELPSVALASNTSETTSSVTFGIVTESIAHGANGFITTSGIIHGLNTNAYDEGAAIYLGSTAGTFTQTKPVAPANSVLVGYIIKKSGGNGSIFVKIQNGYELEELHDVLITSKANNDGLFYESSTSLWKNKSIANVLGYTPANGANYLPLTGGTLTGGLNGTFGNFSSYVNAQTIDLSNSTASNALRITHTNGSYHAVSIIATGTGNSALYASGSVTVVGTIQATSTIIAQAGLSNGAGQSFTLPSSTGTLALTSQLSAYLPLSGGTLTGALSGTSATFSGKVLTTASGNDTFGFQMYKSGTTTTLAGFYQNTTGDGLIAAYNSAGTQNVQIATNGVSYFNGGNLGIGTTSPGAKLDIAGGDLYVRTGGALYANTLAPYSGNMTISLGGSGNNLIVSGGNVGIGTTSPSFPLQVTKTGSDSLIYGYNVAQFGDSTTNAQGLRIATSTSISGLTNLIAATNNDPSQFAFWTWTGSAWGERMRITSGGVVLINQTSLSSAGAGQKFQVATDMLTTGSLAGYFFENRSGGVTSNSNWYGWYATSGTIYLFNGSSNIASISPSTGIYMALSDKNKKKDFEVSNIGLAEIMKLKPTLYRMKSDSNTDSKQLGFLAQEVKEVLPQAYVQTKAENEDFIGLNFNPIVAALTKAVQELKAELDTLKNK